MKVVWSGRALRHLELIKRIVEEHFAWRSEQILEDIVLAPERRLMDFPNTGRPVSEPGYEEYRELILERHILLYRVLEDGVIEVAGVHWQVADRGYVLPAMRDEESSS